MTMFVHNKIYLYIKSYVKNIYKYYIMVYTHL